jgi:putative SOS response-associated peptidase YedK
VAFAGLFEFWRDRSRPEGDPEAWLTSFTIITTAADPGLDRIHDRQPLVLDPDQVATWLDPDEQDPEVVRALLGFARPGRFEAYPVGRAVGSARANGPQLLDPASPDELEGVVDPMTGEVIDA